MKLYLYRGQVKDTKEEWLHYVGDIRFYEMLENGELYELTENHCT